MLLLLIVWVYIHQFSCNGAWKSNPLNIKMLVRKPIFTWKSHSGSFWVIHFAISHRPIRDSISSCDIAGLISEVSEEVASQIAKNWSRQQPHFHLRPPPRATPTSIRIYLIFPETNVIGLHFCWCTRVRFGRSRSFKVIQGQWFWY